MSGTVASIDTLLALWLSPFLRVIAWATVSAAISMVLYVMLSPQQKLIGLKQEQKTARLALKQHEGDFTELWSLIRRDLWLSFRILGLMILPFLLSLLPLLLLMVPLSALYLEPMVEFGPLWMHSFEFWYISVVIIASIVIKIFFKIA